MPMNLFGCFQYARDRLVIRAADVGAQLGIDIVVEGRVVGNQNLYVEAVVRHGFQAWLDFEVGFRPAVDPQWFDVRRHVRRARGIIDPIMARGQGNHPRALLGVLGIEVGKSIHRCEMSIGIDPDHIRPPDRESI